MLINGVRYKIYLFLQGLQHLQKIPPMETFDEKQLLKAISEGDEKAFKTFFLYYYPRIKGFINGLLQSQEEAEDLSQDIFLTLWNNRSPSIPSITLNLIFSAFPKMRCIGTSNAHYCSGTISRKKPKSISRHWKATKPMTTSTSKNSNYW